MSKFASFLYLFLLSQSTINTMIFDKHQSKTALNKDTILPILRVYEFTLNSNLQAFEAFKNVELHKFDAACGDNLCQARASLILEQCARRDSLTTEIESATQDVKQKQKEIMQLRAELEEIIKSKNAKNMRPLIAELKNVSITEFLSNKQINIPIISDDLKSLLFSYFVTQHYSDIGNLGNKRIDEISKKISISKNAAKGIVEDARLSLNVMILKHLDNLAFRLSQVNEPMMYGLNPSNFKDLVVQQVEATRYSSPATFTGMLLLLQDLFFKKANILLKTTIICKEGLHYLKLLYVADKGHYKLIKADKLGETVGAEVFVIEGVSDLHNQCDNFHVDVLDKKISHAQGHEADCGDFHAIVEGLSNFDISELILANAAQHFQFLDNATEVDFSKFPRLKIEFDRLKEQALKKGLCMENSKLFRVTHIFASTLKRELA